MRLKRWFFLVMLFFCFVPVLYAYDAGGQKVYDDAWLLSADAVQDLEEECKEIAEEKLLDVIIVTTANAEGKSAMAYADDFYDEHGFGYDYTQGTGILFLIDMDNREAYISTCGDAIYYFTDARIDAMLDEIVPYLSEGDYEGACEEFLSLTEKYMGRDPYAKPTFKERLLISLERSPIYLVIASIIGGIYVFILVSGRGAKDTTNYMTYQIQKKFNLVQRDDFFMYDKTTSRKIVQDNDGSGGRRGGGSSIHTSSGGVSHGGGGRKF